MESVWTPIPLWVWGLCVTLLLTPLWWRGIKILNESKDSHPIYVQFTFANPKNQHGWRMVEMWCGLLYVLFLMYAICRFALVLLSWAFGMLAQLSEVIAPYLPLVLVLWLLGWMVREFWRIKRGGSALNLYD